LGGKHKTFFRRVTLQKKISLWNGPRDQKRNDFVKKDQRKVSLWTSGGTNARQKERTGRGAEKLGEKIRKVGERKGGKKQSWGESEEAKKKRRDLAFWGGPGCEGG